ncbi:MAG: ThaI family type II restriction endonuclease [Archaeoglobaceae archaeon]
MDKLIQILKNKLEALELLGRFWEMLYIEGSTPDIGKRRENIIRAFLEIELGVKVISAPPMERDWDFQVVFIDGGTQTYSLKTTENITTLKVAWNGFPSIERARKFEFKYPILYVSANRHTKEISVFVFDLEDLNSVKIELGDEMWWIPRSGTNPRGFGINTRALKLLIQKAEAKGNAITKKYSAIDIKSIEREYWVKWYYLLRELATRHV